MAQDLLKRILVRSTKKRLTIEEIMLHPWFKMYQPSQVRRGVIVSETKFKVGKAKLLRDFFEDKRIALVAAKKMEVSPKYVFKMVEDNDKNKYTTLYYLLKRRKDRGDLELEDEIEETPPQSPKPMAKTKKAFANTERADRKREEINKVLLRAASRKTQDARRKNNSRERSRSRGNRSVESRERELPTLRPNVTVNDITVEVKEKITINTTTKRSLASPMGNAHYTKRNFYLSGRGYSRQTPKSNMGIKM
jgi:serine/threonine protein kinase